MTNTQWPSRINWHVVRRVVGRAILWAFMFVASMMVLLPILWTVSTSLRFPRESFSLPPKWLPTDFQWQNYVQVFEEVPFARYILNSFKVTILIVLGQTVTCSMAAYAFARLRFPAKNLLFLLLMSSLMIPVFVTIIPVFVIVRTLGFGDNHAALIVPSLVSAFGVFLLRQFFMTIPIELEEAAFIDGASPLQVFLRVIMPLGAPGIAVLSILSFNSFWNEFFRPLIFLNSWENFTIPLGLVTLRGYQNTGSIALVVAGVSIALVPVLIVFLLMQRYLIEGIALTGLKG